MVRPQGNNGRHSRPHRHPAAWRTRLSSLFCLSLLLALLLVPSAHHPCLLAPADCCHQTHPRPGGHNELHFTSADPARPHPHHHDPAVCLICQAALSSHYFSVPTHFQPQPIICPGQRLFARPPDTFPANSYLLISNPRSPPHLHPYS